MIHNVNVSSIPVALNAARKSGYVDATGIDKAVQATSIKTDIASMSTLSRQLGESAVRAEARDKSMSREQLSEFARKSIDHFAPEYASAKKAQHDLETPKTDDPELLERARQATVYVNKVAAQDPSAKNPFASLTREQAALIAYDDKGPYTANERRAAWRHGTELEERWRTGLMARGTQESSNNGGRVLKFMKECLDHYKALPAIEQAQYDQGYESRLKFSIKEQSGADKASDRQLNLYEILAGIQLPEKKKREESIPVRNPPAAVKKIAEPVPMQAGVIAPDQPKVTNPAS